MTPIASIYTGARRTIIMTGHFQFPSRIRLEFVIKFTLTSKARRRTKIQFARGKFMHTKSFVDMRFKNID